MTSDEHIEALVQKVVESQAHALSQPSSPEFFDVNDYCTWLGDYVASCPSKERTEEGLRKILNEVNRKIGWLVEQNFRQSNREYILMRLLSECQKVLPAENEHLHQDLKKTLGN